MNLEVEHSAAGGRSALIPRGELDLETRTIVLTRGTELLTALDPGSQLVIDLREVSFVDSSGLGVLVALTNNAASLGCAVIMLNPSPAVSKLFDLTGLDKAFVIERDDIAS
ncbi:MAG: anti-sigma factor antagonist [Pseudonocardiales bacterium]|jgi:anti-sigma B factor antagonist|nr:anti-sigma factor antagonist [Pseudonocardiales bacterium]